MRAQRLELGCADRRTESRSALPRANPLAVKLRERQCQALPEHRRPRQTAPGESGGAAALPAAVRREDEVGPALNVSVRTLRR